MQSTATFALTMAVTGQIALSVSILCMRGWRTQTYLPLAAFFIAVGIITASPAVSAFVPAMQTYVVALALPAYMLLGPMLGLYVEGLTSEAPWQFQRRHLWHLLPFAFGLLGTIMIACLPEYARKTLFVDGEMATGVLSLIVVFYIIFLIFGWLGQSGYYLVSIFRRLSRYRIRLKDLFASNETRELQWLIWLVFVIGGVWLVTLAALVSDNFGRGALFGPQSSAAISLILVWTLAVWGLRQKPGFEGRYLGVLPALDTGPVPSDESKQKYQRSALDAGQAAKIAGKIETAIKTDSLFLDSALSLHKLAKHISVSPNYISQTLNETIGESFFDYVNRMRIEFAKPMVIEGTKSILAISLEAGFNARSSFYKAFRRETGHTPSEFRKVHREEGREKK